MAIHGVLPYVMASSVGSIPKICFSTKQKRLQYKYTRDLKYQSNQYTAVTHESITLLYPKSNVCFTLSQNVSLHE